MYDIFNIDISTQQGVSTFYLNSMEIKLNVKKPNIFLITLINDIFIIDVTTQQGVSLIHGK